MSQAARSAAAVRLDAAGAASALKRELAAGRGSRSARWRSPAIFALLLALSRTPGMDKAPLWPIGFFYKGLVIHVVFSLVIWLLGVFAFLTTARRSTWRASGPRAAPLGRLGQGVVLIAFPCLFAPAFLDATAPELTQLHPAHSSSGL